MRDAWRSSPPGSFCPVTSEFLIVPVLRDILASEFSCPSLSIVLVELHYLRPPLLSCCLFGWECLVEGGPFR